MVVASLGAAAGTVWFADGNNLFRLDTATNQTVVSIKADDIRVLVANTDASAWALSRKRLTRYGASGAAITELELQALGLKNADHMSLDSRDGSLWIAEGKEDDEQEDEKGDGRAKRIVRLDSDGSRVHDFNSPGRIRAMAPGLDQSL